MHPRSTVGRAYRQAIGSDNFEKRWAEKANEQLNMFIYDYTGSVTPMVVYGMIRYMAVELNIKHVFIDSLVKCGINSQENEPQKIFLSRLQDLAKEHQVHIHLVHHIRKSASANDVPDKFSVKGAGELVDLADNLIIVHRNRELQNKKNYALQNNNMINGLQFKDIQKPDSKLILDKQRHFDFEGIFNFWWHAESQQWIDNDRGEYHKYVK